YCKQLQIFIVQYLVGLAQFINQCWCFVFIVINTNRKTDCRVLHQVYFYSCIGEQSKNLTQVILSNKRKILRRNRHQQLVVLENKRWDQWFSLEVFPNYRSRKVGVHE